MSTSLNGTGDYYEATSAPVTDYPLTLAAWFNPNNVTATGIILSVGVASGSHRFQLVAAGATGGDPITATVIGSTNSDATTTTGYTAGSWYHACGVFSSSTSRTAYINGGSQGTSSTSNTVTGINNVLIGARWATTRGAFFPGLIAEVGIWNAALTDMEVLSLSRGVSPAHVRPQALVLYAPLVRSAIDVRGGRVLTAGGSPSVGVHPRMYL